MLNMSALTNQINKYTGFDFKMINAMLLQNGRKVQRASLRLGNMTFAVLFIEVPEIFNFNSEIKDIVTLAEYEKVIIHTAMLQSEEMSFLKEKRIGYIDDQGHFYFPLDIISNDLFEAKEHLDIKRSPSILNEFPIGFLFFKNFGLLEHTQAEIGKLINKSAATVNLVLKRMEKEQQIVKIDNGYHLANLENYFERWRFIISQYKAKSAYSRFQSELSDEELKSFLKEKQSEGKWSLSGARIEALLDDGYLQGAKDLSVFFEVESQKKIYKDLKLIPSAAGEVILYPSALDLREQGQMVHEILVSAELLSSNNSRVKEAGQKRFEKYLIKAKKVINERFGHKYF
jgi:hypothetical protein